MTDMRRVAELAGVSLGTVSNVLNRPHLVAELTRRVKQAIAETGFVRNGSARQLQAGHSPLIGLVVLDVSNPFLRRWRAVWRMRPTPPGSLWCCAIPTILLSKSSVTFNCSRNNVFRACYHPGQP
ncbi:MAG TPA: LacI family DNA-binding transcriptional regulator [Ktedonobacterales bacterium]|nr:LacI family DNA-binding transcriptional regulator [Ktedonobacterales bacterium]